MVSLSVSVWNAFEKKNNFSLCQFRGVSVRNSVRISM